MKHYQSTIEGTWVEILPVTLTEEQQAIMSSIDKYPAEDVKAVMDTINEQKTGAVHEDMAQLLTTFYNTKKPELKETDTYQLVAMDVTENNGDLFGILNCRVNGEHVQVRF